MRNFWLLLAAVAILAAAAGAGLMRFPTPRDLIVAMRGIILPRVYQEPGRIAATPPTKPDPRIGVGLKSGLDMIRAEKAKDGEEGGNKFPDAAVLVKKEEQPPKPKLKSSPAGFKNTFYNP